ncbi:Nramp family divalent metal transporter [Halegenticoccus tardaugens]|uniref:Nramp family divalent metal transporter n=1 Tax=Halegenticoccus tardaugens TaxID=2071624 RepID=UPI00100B8D0C|nr:Nramp family divalent metal transporter [Halegenticoccus tardaugens]
MSTSYASQLRDTASGFFQEYGLAFVMVASYFGSGSVYIASSAGVRYGYALLWAVVGAVLLGFMAQDMSARLGIHGDSLMQFTRRKLGGPAATGIALLLSVGCVAWTLELTAAVGKGVSIMLGGAIGWQPLAVVTGALAIVVGVMNYDGIERVMTAMMLALLVCYLVVAGGADASLPDLAAGFVPRLPDAGALTLAAAIMGTTALWPNFFLESNLVAQKGWTDVADVSTMRRDLGVGYLVGGVTTVAIVVVAAAVLRPAGYTSLDTFITPGLALSEVLGEWAMALFLVGAVAAAFNSIIPIMWTPSYLLQHARGRDADSASREFKLIYAVGVGLGSLSPLVHELFGLSVVDMIILFPAYNGIVGLPITALLLFWAVNDRKTMGEHRNGLALAAVNFALVALALYLSVTSAPGFFESLTSGGL